MSSVTNSLTRSFIYSLLTTFLTCLSFYLFGTTDWTEGRAYSRVGTTLRYDMPWGYLGLEFVEVEDWVWYGKYAEEETDLSVVGSGNFVHLERVLLSTICSQNLCDVGRTIE